MSSSFFKTDAPFSTILTSYTDGSEDISLYNDNDSVSKKTEIRWNITQEGTNYLPSGMETYKYKRVYELITMIYDIPWMNTCLKEHILINLLFRHFPVITEEDHKYKCTDEVVQQLNHIIPMRLLAFFENNTHYYQAMPYLRLFNLIMLSIKHHASSVEEDSVPLSAIMNLFSRKIRDSFSDEAFTKFDNLFKDIVSNVGYADENGTNNCESFLHYRIRILDSFLDEFKSISSSDNEFFLFHAQTTALWGLLYLLCALAPKNDLNPFNSTSSSKEHLNMVICSSMAFICSFLEIFLPDENYINHLTNSISRISELKSVIESFNDKEKLEHSLIEIFKLIEPNTDCASTLYVFKKYDTPNTSV